MTDAAQHTLDRPMSLGHVQYDGRSHTTTTATELTALARSHRRLLWELRLITATINNNTDLSTLLDSYTFSSNSDASGNSKDAAWVDSNDITLGHHYDDSSLFFPRLPSVEGSGNQAKLDRDEEALIDALVSGESVSDAIQKALSDPTTNFGPGRPPRANTSSPSVDHDALGLESEPFARISTTDRRSSPAKNVLISTAQARSSRADLVDDEASMDAATFHPHGPHSPAKTVHLPPEPVQLARMHARREVHENGRSKVDEPAAQTANNLHVHTEQQPSSPSSTVGAYSATTPMPAQDSPDTSPNSEVDDIDMLAPKDLRPSPEERAAQLEHDRLLEVQKEIAKKAAMGDDATPDDQLRWEEREAAAREAEERAAREKTTFSAGDVLDIIKRGQMLTADRASRSPSTKPLTRHIDEKSVKAIEEEPVSVQDRKSADAISPSTSLDPPASPFIVKMVPAQIEAIPHSKIIADDRPDKGRDNDLSIDLPVQDDTRAMPTSNRPTSSRELPIHAARPPMVLLPDLTSLKGAADDSDRDYLEPLFRIQAHDSPSAPTKPLPNLVKDAAKCLSTEDHYTTTHERLDYRILRRIYHLQNANKWSLRQMEKCPEPDQPVTHLDFMMAEMRWMRKDFRAERKMKQSICAWLAERCAEWVCSSHEHRRSMQVRVKPISAHSREMEDDVPELESAGDSAPEDDSLPRTPLHLGLGLQELIVEPSLVDLVSDLSASGKLPGALHQLPAVDVFEVKWTAELVPMTAVSKFVDSKIMPTNVGPIRKRSRFDYADEAEEGEWQLQNKRMCNERDLAAESEEVALFHPDNKHIRDRLHANTAFRPPSEFVMPSISFYEFRNGSQWIWEDDQKLRKLAKDYCFNWSLIADEMTLPSRYKSSAERRTPWECFERWVELETLPAEMRKTMYFKTWYQRLEQSQQAAERRYQAQVAAIQQAQNSQAPVPTRRRTNPTRVEKRKNSRYLWLVDAMRKLARKRETNAYKLADSQRLAAQRKAQSDGTPQTRGPMLTPQEFSKRRYERDVQMAEAQRQHRAKLMETQQRQMQMARAAHQQQQQQQQMQQQQQQQPVPHGVAMPAGGIAQRPGSGNLQSSHTGRTSMGNGSVPNGMMHINGHVPPAARGATVMRAGHGGVAMINGQAVPQAQLRGAANMVQHADMQRLAQANAQRNAQYGSPAYHLTNGQMPVQNAVMTSQQQSGQAAMTPANGHLANANLNGTPNHAQGHGQNGVVHHTATSPSMPPPPTPNMGGTMNAGQGGPQQLSSGHVPALLAIKNELRQKNPQWSEDQLNHTATHQLSQRSRDQSSTQVRQSAMNAAAGLHAAPAQQYAQHVANYPSGGAVANNGVAYGAGDVVNNPQATANQNAQAQAYAAQMRQRQLQMMRMQQQTASQGGHGGVNGGNNANTAHTSPNMAPVSPSVTFSNLAPVPGTNMSNAARPPSRNNTPQTPKVILGSMSNVQTPNVTMAAAGVQSPGAIQVSPRVMQAKMAR